MSFQPTRQELPQGLPPTVTGDVHHPPDDATATDTIEVEPPDDAAATEVQPHSSGTPDAQSVQPLSVQPKRGTTATGKMEVEPHSVHLDVQSVQLVQPKRGRGRPPTITEIVLPNGRLQSQLQNGSRGLRYHQQGQHQYRPQNQHQYRPQGQHQYQPQNRYQARSTNPRYQQCFIYKKDECRLWKRRRRVTYGHYFTVQIQGEETERTS